MPDIYIQYNIETRTISARTSIVQTSATGPGFSLIKSKTANGKTTHYRIKVYKTIAAAVRASRRWMHDTIQAAHL